MWAYVSHRNLTSYRYVMETAKLQFSEHNYNGNNYHGNYYHGNYYHGNSYHGNNITWSAFGASVHVFAFAPLNSSFVGGGVKGDLSP